MTSLRSGGQDLRFLDGGGEMGGRMRAMNWARTPLGLPETWPQSLRSTVSMLLPSKAQIILFWGPEFAVLYNDAYRPVFGAKHPHALGWPGRDAWREIWDSVLHPLLATVVRSGEAFWAKDMLFELERYGFPEETYFDVSYDPVRVESGDVGGVYCIVTETTERVIGGRRLALLKDLAERNAAARTTADACRLAIETIAEWPQDIPFALTYFDDQVQSATPDALARLGRTPHEFIRELTVSAGSAEDSRAVRLVVGVNPKRPFDDQYRAFLDLVVDQLKTAVSNARAYEQERNRAEALAALDRAKTMFFSNVSHEFRTPLTLLVGPIEDGLADADTPLPVVHRERQEVAHRSALRLLRLVNTLLDFSRIEAGRADASYEPTDLARLTRELAALFASAVERAGLTFTVDCEPLVEPVYVDRDMWEKIVFNLLSNALKFTFEGGIALRLHESAGGVELTVSDSGVGIPAADLPRMFERFHRVKHVRARTHEGTGIGLALVQELARLHGGQATVHSQEGRGATFTVRIRTGTSHLPPERIAAARQLTPTDIGVTAYVEEALRWLPPGASSSSDEPRVLAPDAAVPSVLVADDNADMRDYLSRILGSRYRLETVSDGLAALQCVRERQPDLVLSDVMMPGLDGFGLLKEIRGDERIRSIPVILLSARAGEEARVEGLQAGASDYLVKPFSARELLASVGSQLALSQMRRETERALRLRNEQSAYLAAIVDSAEDAIISKDLNGVIQSCNVAAERLFGYTASELIGKPVRILIPAERQQEEDDILERMRSGQRVEHFETERLTKDGTLVDVALTISPVRNDAGVIIGASKIARDITLLKRVEREHVRLLRENAEVTETLNRVGAVVASDLDRDNVLQAVTDTATTLTGAKFGAFFYNQLGESGESYTLYTISGVARDAFSQFPMPRNTPVFEATFKGTGVVLSDDITKDPRYGHNPPHSGMPHGHLPVRSYLAVPVKGRSGEVLGGLFFGHPEAGQFTAHHQRLAEGIASWAAVALENARLYASVQEASRLKDEFLASLSHELRTPLNAILGYSRILRAGIVPPDKKDKAIETIDRNATSLTQIVEDVLDMSRIVAGKMRLNVQPVVFPDVVRNAIDAIMPAADAKGVRVEVVIDPAATPIAGDPERLQQVLWNLLSNAVKFTPRGGRVQVRLEQVNSHVEVTISDTGIGIPHDFLPYVFERFRQADGGITREHGGLGLGLSISRQLIEMHGGTIEAASAGVNHGATFRVRLPVMIVHPTAREEVRTHPRSSATGLPRAMPDLRNIRVLAVDDEADALALISEVLRAAGAQVSTARSAEDALKSLESDPPDVVVADLGMPLVDGFQFIQSVRQHPNPAVHRVPAAALTAYARSEDRIRALNAGFQIHLAKPIDPIELMTTIAALARRSAAEQRRNPAL